MTDTENDSSSLARDRGYVAEQIGREPRAMRGVAVRCPFGVPAVTDQAPVDEQGRPFPTAYYVTCPHLVRQIDRLESRGEIASLEQRVASDEALRTATQAAQERHARIDDRGVAIAASGDPARLKCLHAHAAFALAAGEHPLGDLVLAMAEPRWCADARCLGSACNESLT